MLYIKFLLISFLLVLLTISVSALDVQEFEETEYGVQINLPTTTTTTSGGGGGANPFDQSLNTTENVQFANLTLGETITFALGEIIDNIINGIIRITGNLLVTGGINATDWSNVTIMSQQISNANGSFENVIAGVICPGDGKFSQFNTVTNVLTCAVDLTITNASDCPNGEYLDGTGNCNDFNASVAILLISTYYNATQSSITTGTIDGGGLFETQHKDRNYDGQTFNFSEETGSPGLDLRMNFTNVDGFNQGVMRYKTSNLIGAYPLIQVWDYVDSVWEDYPPVSTSEGFAIISQAVFDNADHLQDNVVQMRIYKASNGNPNNHYYIDWVTIIDGLGTPSGEEVDPYSYHTDANINATGYNVTADYFFGNGSQLTDTLTCNSSGSCISGGVAYMDYSNAGSFNITGGNLTIDQNFTICLNAHCTRYILDNGSDILIQG